MNRCALLDLTRFMASLLIMTFNLSVIEIKDYPFFDAHIFVVYFFMVTGYYTAKHFDGKNNDSPIKDSVAYTIKKYLPFIPYLIVIQVLAWGEDMVKNCYIFDYPIINYLPKNIEHFCFDLLLISETYTSPLVAPLWYLSAMLIVFPFFCWIMQISNRYLIMIICIAFPLIWYGQIGMSTGNTVMRALAGMCLGAFVYETSIAFKDYIQKINKILLTFIEILVFTFVLISTFRNWNTYRLDVLCFVVCLTTMLSGFSYAKNIKGNVFIYLGKLSVPVYMSHYCIGIIVNDLGKLLLWNNVIKISLFYGATILFSMLVLYIVNNWKWFQKIINKPIELKD